METFFPMADLSHPIDSQASVEDAAGRVAALLTGTGGGIRDPSGSALLFEKTLAIRPLPEVDPASLPDVWAVDGGQALVADARCLQIYVTRAATVRWDPVAGRSALEDEGEIRAHVLGLGEDRHSLAALGAPVAPDSSVDVNLLRDWGEWAATAAAVRACEPDGMVLVDGDLQPDWRIPNWWLSDLLELAYDRRVTLAGVTKHTSLSWGGSPLLGVLERNAGEARTRWWSPIARTRSDVGPGIQVVVARLDPDARFSFRVDLPGGADPERELARLATLSDDAAFPGYPYPLSVADRLAACPGWVREEVWSRMDEHLERLGVDRDVRERAFTDRHRLMERY